jgi:hypothetical protein
MDSLLNPAYRPSPTNARFSLSFSACILFAGLGKSTVATAMPGRERGKNPKFAADKPVAGDAAAVAHPISG